MDLVTFLKILLRNWWIFLLAVVTTVGTAVYVVSRSQPVYQATATVLLRPSPALTDPRLVIDSQNSLERRTLINSLARSVTTSHMRDQIAKQLQVQPDVVGASQLMARVVPETNVIELRAISLNPRLAAAITNAAADELSNQVPVQTLQMDVIDRAVPPQVPIEPRPVRVITMAALFGVIIGSISAVVAHFVTGQPGQVPSGRSAQDIEGSQDYPVEEQMSQVNGDRLDERGGQASASRTRPLFTR